LRPLKLFRRDVIDRSKEENLSFCERRIHREALNILLEATG
jgi:hypothetical protein